MQRIKTAAYIILVPVAIVLAALFLRSCANSLITANSPLPPVNLSVPATPSKPVIAMPLESIPYVAPTIQAYPAKAKKKVSLPAVVQADENQHLIASTEVKADKHPQQINTLLNTSTGESETFVTRLPSPWLAWDTHGEASISAGIKNGTPTARLQIRQGLFQIKAVHFGAVASLDQPLTPQPGQGTEYFAGATAWVEW